ncbi:hypothetical protein BGZ57DRAFT_858417 [Hyaloscypha finlandica]|jgi:hypothetical protein|nr:hypothetical protein BGZ57DRAFT_858417 [Hyaloscypha finlandica]
MALFLANHHQEVAGLMDIIANAPVPDSAIWPTECDPYLRQTASQFLKFTCIMIGGMTLMFMYLAFSFASLGKEHHDYVLKHLAEATLEEREEELMRLCKERGIKVEKLPKLY